MPFPKNIIPNTYLTTSNVNSQQIISGASNLRAGDNPSYTLADFLSAYPQFEEVVVPTVLQMFIDLAHASIKESRYHDAWKLCMGYFVAHFATLWVQSSADPGSPAAQVLEAGKAQGLDTSQSVGGVSVSTDYSAIANDLNGWAAFKLTVYGQQLATIGKLIGKGGMMVW